MDPTFAPPLVLLHGWTGSSADFAPILGPLGTTRRVFAPELPGLGLAAQVDWLLARLDQEDIGEFHLLGHSLGGLLAQSVARLAAHRVTGLVLVGTGPGRPDDQTVERVSRIARAATEGGTAAGWAVVMAGADDPSSDPRHEFVKARFMAMDPADIQVGATALINAHAAPMFLRCIDVPVLVCHGQGDTSWLPETQRLMARMIPGAEYSIIPDALHSPAVENPDGMLEILHPFLRRADAHHLRLSTR